MEQFNFKLQKHNPALQFTGVAICLVCLLIIYVFQRFDYLNFFRHQLSLSPAHPYTTFVFNRALRLLLNDAVCIMVISILFREKRFIRLAGWLFVLEFFIILPVYCFVKLSLEGTSEISSPFLAQIHRLIVNPMLMILLMIAFFYQKIKSPRS